MKQGMMTMTKSELHKHIHPEVAEKLSDMFEKTTLLVGTLDNMVAGQHYEAAAQVSKQVSGQVAEFKEFLDALHKEALSYNEKQAGPVGEATNAGSAEASPSPAAPEPGPADSPQAAPAP